MDEILLRPATEKDIDFIIETITEAEKSGTDKIVLCSLFSLNEEEYKLLLREMLNENLEGQPYCISQFLIAESNGEYAGACCAWIESLDGISSTVLTGNLLFGLIDRGKFSNYKELAPLFQGLYIERTPGALQLEFALVRDKFKGRGIAGRIFDELIRQHRIKHAELRSVEFIVAKSNEKAMKAYQKLGYHVTAEKHVEDKRIIELAPSDTVVMWKKDLLQVDQNLN